MVFDTSIFLVFLHKEEKHLFIRQLLETAKQRKNHLYASEISLLELHYTLIRELGEAKSRATMITVENLPVDFIPIDRHVLMLAAAFKATAKMSLGDSIIAATAQKLDMPLLTKDPEFKSCKNQIKVEFL